MSAQKTYFLVINDEAEGPFTKDQVLEKLKAGEIDQDHFCCPVGDDQWGTVRQHIFIPPSESQRLSTKGISNKETVKIKLPPIKRRAT